MYLRYADWFIRSFVPDVDQAPIDRISLDDERFFLHTEDGRKV